MTSARGDRNKVLSAASKPELVDLCLRYEEYMAEYRTEIARLGEIEDHYKRLAAMVVAFETRVITERKL